MEEEALSASHLDHQASLGDQEYEYPTSTSSEVESNLIGEDDADPIEEETLLNKIFDSTAVAVPATISMQPMRPAVSEATTAPPVASAVTNTASTHSEFRLYQPRVQDDRNVAVLGRFGVGKTAIVMAILGQMIGSYAGWRDGSDNSSHRRSLEEYSLLLFDTKGCRGDRRLDWYILRKLAVDLAMDAAKLDCIFLCFSSTRFPPGDEELLKLILSLTTPEFQRCIHVVITHSPELRVNDEFRDDVVRNLRFLGSTREEILARVHFVDLLHPDSFPLDSLSRIEVEAKWRAAQRELYHTVLTMRERVPVQKIFRLNFVQQLYYVYTTEIYFIAICLLLALVAYALFRSTGLNAEQQKVIDTCILNNQDLLKELDAAKAYAFNNVTIANMENNYPWNAGMIFRRIFFWQK